MSVANKRKSSSSAPAKHAAKVHVTADNEDQPTAAAAATAADDIAADDAAPTLTDQQRYMQMAYQVGSSSTAAAAAAAKKRSNAAGAVGVPFYADAPLTPVQLAFVNHGLANWLTVRQTWIARDSLDTKKSSKKSNSPTDAAAAASSSGKTQLPHPLSEHALPKRAAVDSDSDSDAFVADDGSSSDDDGFDINLNVPRIIAAREAYAVFEPRVKLSHMVDILNACWEEEESD